LSVTRQTLASADGPGHPPRASTGAPRSPAEIARETLRRLAVSRMPPTPENYQRVYLEILGGDPAADARREADTPDPIESALARLTPAASVRGEAALGRLRRAVQRRDWEAFAEEVGSLVREAGPRAEGVEGRSWGEVIGDLMRQYEVRHAGVSVAQKRDGLLRVLGGFGRSPVLRERLDALAHAWSAGPVAAADVEVCETPTEPPGPEKGTAAVAAPAPGVSGGTERLGGLLADLLRREVSRVFAAGSEATTAIAALADQAQVVRTEADAERVASMLEAFRAADFPPAPGDVAVTDDLLSLVRLLIDNLGSLVDDDQWIGGQVEVMRQVVAQPPGPAMLAEARDRFTRIVRRQADLRESLVEARTTLRDMIGVFVERMGEMSQSTSDYHDRIGDHARRIDASEDLTSFRGALDGLMVDMRQMQQDARRARDEVASAREQAQAAEQRIRTLETELEGVSGKLREDALTGSLNRRGLDETLAREVARAARYGNALSIGVIDIDNFKRLNDTYGHQTGDRALIHLVRVVQSLLRPTDTIGRFGGEEFVIVLPETAAEAGQSALERLQRELTRQFFLANNERLLITFSGGVAQLREGEDERSLVARADEAMYRAKQAGRNRVFVAA